MTKETPSEVEEAEKEKVTRRPNEYAPEKVKGISQASKGDVKEKDTREGENEISGREALEEIDINKSNSIGPCATSKQAKDEVSRDIVTLFPNRKTSTTEETKQLLRNMNKTTAGAEEVIQKNGSLRVAPTSSVKFKEGLSAKSEEQQVDIEDSRTSVANRVEAFDGDKRESPSVANVKIDISPTFETEASVPRSRTPEPPSSTTKFTAKAHVSPTARTPPSPMSPLKQEDIAVGLDIEDQNKIDSNPQRPDHFFDVFVAKTVEKMEDPAVKRWVCGISFLLSIGGVVLSLLFGFSVIGTENEGEEQIQQHYDISSTAYPRACIDTDVKVPLCVAEGPAASSNQNPIGLKVEVKDNGMPVSGLGLQNFGVTTPTPSRDMFSECSLDTCGNESFVPGDGIYTFFVRSLSGKNWFPGIKFGSVRVMDDTGGERGFSTFEFLIEGVSIDARVTGFVGKPAMPDNHNPVKLTVLVWDEGDNEPVRDLDAKDFAVAVTSGDEFGICDTKKCDESHAKIYYGYFYVLILDRTGTENWTEGNNTFDLTVSNDDFSVTTEIGFTIPITFDDDVLEVFIPDPDITVCMHRDPACMEDENHTRAIAHAGNHNLVKLSVLVWHDINVYPIPGLEFDSFNLTKRISPTGDPDSFEICNNETCGSTYFTNEEIRYDMFLHPVNLSNWIAGVYEGTIEVHTSRGSSGYENFTFRLEE